MGIPTYGKKRIETVHGIEEPCTTPRDHYVTNVHYLFQREIIRCGLILRVIDLRNRGGGGDGTPWYPIVKNFTKFINIKPHPPLHGVENGKGWVRVSK